MQKRTKRLVAVGVLAQMAFACTAWQSSALAEEAVYPPMAPGGQYLMSRKAEIALARSAAPAAISANATVMVLHRNGYVTVAKGGNGFLCLVERSWGNATNDPEFWNPKVRGPICFNPAAARTFAPIYLMKTKWVMSGKSTAEIARTLASAFKGKNLLALEPGAMCYMLSKRQYLSGADGIWHPHLMFYVSGNAEKDWGGNLPGSPVIATNDPEEHATIFMVRVSRWSDGSLAPQPD